MSFIENAWRSGVNSEHAVRRAMLKTAMPMPPGGGPMPPQTPPPSGGPGNRMPPPGVQGPPPQGMQGPPPRPPQGPPPGMPPPSIKPIPAEMPPALRSRLHNQVFKPESVHSGLDGMHSLMQQSKQHGIEHEAFASESPNSSATEN